MSSRSAILGRIREAFGKQPPSPPITRDYRQAASLDPATRLELFAERLADYNAGVYSCVESDLAHTIAQAMEARAKRSLVIPPAFPLSWLPSGIEFIPDHALDYAALDRSEGALTASSVAIALTGTIILTHGPLEGRRALSLIPDYHLCIVRADRIFETAPEGMRALQSRNNPITTISGPSATADIEMIRVKGVHGPRTLDVIITEAQP